MDILNEQFLAIEDGWLANYVARGLYENTKAKVELPSVTQVSALNTYTQDELRWYFGINSENLDGKLVAIIPVFGPLSRGWSYEGTSTEWIATQLKVAEENQNVVSVVMRLSTPGGAVNGMNAFGKAVASMKKPVLGYVESMCASAGLVPAAHCNEVWLESAFTTAMGSLGVMATYISITEKNKKDGIDVRVLRSKGSEDKNLLNMMEPINEAAMAEMQGVADAMRVEMLADIRSGRPKVSKDISGAIYYGKKAIDAGFADNVGSLSDVVKRAFVLGVK